jgi:NAD(P)-dependent dehydrogenase (short-subunit alcohol dehydrogenase family)
MTAICEDRVVLVTGAGQGIGREHALAFAAHGARVVVNDIADVAAEQVAREIVSLGGDAVAALGDIADWDVAERIVHQVAASHGRLDVLVNNAGLLRDRMLVNMSEDEWDQVVRVDLKGHFCPLRHAAAHWRERAKTGEDVQARVINTSSGAGLFGSVGQSNYTAAKAGVAGLTVIAAAELARYGVTVNAIAPAARTSMTEAVFAASMSRPERGFDAMHPANVSPLVVWLGSVQSGGVTGRVFEVSGGALSVAGGWQHGAAEDKGARWEPGELGPVVARLLAGAPPPTAVYGA